MLLRVRFTSSSASTPWRVSDWMAPMSRRSAGRMFSYSFVWMSVPFVALSIYAGLTQVSTEVLEAAELDGANGIQRLRFIILPLIAPVISIVMLLQLIWDLRVFTQIKLLQDAGGVANETNLLGTYVYQLGTGKGDFGTASAVSILILGLTIALSWYYVRSLMKEES